MYILTDFICMGYLELQGAKTKNYKMKNSWPQRDSNSRPLNHKSSVVSIKGSLEKICLSSPVVYNFSLKQSWTEDM